MSEDTRKDKRAKAVSLNIRYKSATVDEFIENHSHDVSRGGFFVKTVTPFAPGTLLKFEVRLAGDERVIAGVGRVVWKRDPSQTAAEKPAGMGVKFVKLEDASRAIIERLVAEKSNAGAAFTSEKPVTQEAAKQAPSTLRGIVAAPPVEPPVDFGPLSESRRPTSPSMNAVRPNMAPKPLLGAVAAAPRSSSPSRRDSALAPHGSSAPMVPPAASSSSGSVPPAASSSGSVSPAAVIRGSVAPPASKPEAKAPAAGPPRPGLAVRKPPMMSTMLGVGANAGKLPPLESQRVIPGAAALFEAREEEAERTHVRGATTTDDSKTAAAWASPSQAPPSAPAPGSPREPMRHAQEDVREEVDARASSPRISRPTEPLSLSLSLPKEAPKAASAPPPPRPEQPMFPAALTSAEPAAPAREQTVMKQAAELLEEALLEAGGSIDEIGQNPVFGSPQVKKPVEMPLARASGAAFSPAIQTKPVPSISPALSPSSPPPPRKLLDDVTSSQRQGIRASRAVAAGLLLTLCAAGAFAWRTGKLTRVTGGRTAAVPSAPNVSSSSESLSPPVPVAPAPGLAASMAPSAAAVAAAPAVAAPPSLAASAENKPVAIEVAAPANSVALSPPVIDAGKSAPPPAPRAPRRARPKAPAANSPALAASEESPAAAPPPTPTEAPAETPPAKEPANEP